MVNPSLPTFPRPLKCSSFPAPTLCNIQIFFSTKSAVRPSQRLAVRFNQRIGREKIALSYFHHAVQYGYVLASYPFPLLALTDCPSALQYSLSPKGLYCAVSVCQWSVRRIFLIIPRMKCRCPYSASVMIGHARSVERLYPHWGQA